MPHDITSQRTTDRFEVAVVGGGLSGVCAALAAARGGATTALITDRPVLGGNSSSELRVPPAGSGYYNPWAVETGIVHELVMEDRARNHDMVQYGHANGVWDYVLYDACRREPLLTLLLNVNVTGVTMVDDRTIASVTGPQAGSGLTLTIPADLFIDASGDGAVGVGAGVPWIMGPEARSVYGESFAPESPDDFVMGNTLTFRARDVGYEVDYRPPSWAQIYDYPDGIPHRSTAQFAGGYWWIEVGWPFHTMHDQDEIRDELLRHVYGIWDHIKNRGPQREQAKTWVLDWVGMLPAKRESRRFTGAYVLREQDLLGRTDFDDVVAYGGWSIDDHTRGGILAVEKRPSFDDRAEIHFFCRPYGVPLRSLIAAEVDNLMFAGRVMSASRVAFSSLRVQQTLATTGQAAGTAAAVAIREKVAPLALTSTPALLTAVQQRLMRDDAWLLNRRLEDLTAGATATASSVGAVTATPGIGGIPLAHGPASLWPLSEPRIETVACFLDHHGEPGPVTVTVHQAANVWDLEALEAPPLATVTGTVQPGTGWQSFDLGLELPSPGLYWVKLHGPAGAVWRYAADDALATVCAYQRPKAITWFAPATWSRWRSLAMAVTPESRPYTADLALNGANRPDTSPNAWISDAAQPLPQWLEVALPEPRVANVVQVVFDTQLNRNNYVTPGLFRAPECVRDYRVELRVDGAWREAVREIGNYQRLREHGFETAEIEAVRLTVVATNGAPEARICAVRLFLDSQ